jgi:predicted amidohydrolase
VPGVLRIAAAQLGPVARAATRADVVARLVALMEQAAARQARLVVFPELALTSFFPRWLLDDAELDRFYETSMPGPATQPLFDAARRLGLAFSLGYAELTPAGRRFNSSLLVAADGRPVAGYRKVHRPGDREFREGAAFQHLEKRYFETGDGGFVVHAAPLGGSDVRTGLLICNDRRWPEAWRVLGLQGVELVLLGFNTPLHNPEAPAHDAYVQAQHRLVVQAGAYQNACWAVAVAKAGVEEGQALLSDTIIVAPSGEIVAASQTEGDEIVVADCDLDLARSYRESIFDFAAHREPQAYGLIVERKGAGPAPGPA